MKASSKEKYRIIDLDQRKVPHRVIRVGELARGAKNNETHRTKYPLWMILWVTLRTVNFPCPYQLTRPGVCTKAKCVLLSGGSGAITHLAWNRCASYLYFSHWSVGHSRFRKWRVALIFIFRTFIWHNPDPVFIVAGSVGAG